MKLIVNNQVLERLKDEFPHLSKKKYVNTKDEKPLKAYFASCEEELKYVMSIEKMKDDSNLHDYDLSVIEDVLGRYGYDLSVRAEALSIDIFVDIANNLTK